MQIVVEDNGGRAVFVDVVKEPTSLRRRLNTDAPLRPHRTARLGGSTALRMSFVPGVTKTDEKITVVGASGYIGSHICLTLVKKGYHVRACVRNPSDFPKTT